MSASFSSRDHFICASSDVIYLITCTCKKCNIQYVGQTQQKFNINCFPDIVTTVSEHFDSQGHSIKDFAFMPIDRVTGNRKETYEVLPGCIMCNFIRVCTVC